MSPQDHNKTLVILHAALGAFFTLGLLASPWIIAQNFRQREKIPLAVVIFGVVFVLALLFWATAIAMYRRKTRGSQASHDFGDGSVANTLASRGLFLVVHA